MTARDLGTAARTFMHPALRPRVRASSARAHGMCGSGRVPPRCWHGRPWNKGWTISVGRSSPRVRGASRHAQLLCLGEFIRDEELVSRTRHAWHGLSRACHHQVYKLSPTEAELSTWLDAVDRLVAHDPIGQ